MKVAFIRVGIDKVCGGIHSPIFKDDTFEFIPIPEYYNKTHALPLKDTRTYSTEKGRMGKPFIDYFKEGKDKEAHRDCTVHLDPEFVTYTYGDPNYTKNSLVNLSKGDYLVFYTLLQGASGDTREPAFYVIGYFEVEYSALAVSEDEYELLKSDFKNNFHIKNKEIYERDIHHTKNKGLKLVKGTSESRLLKYAYLISSPDKTQIPGKKSGHVISPDMQKIFGNFGGKVSIQKSPLRWVRDKQLVAKTAEWLKGLA